MLIIWDFDGVICDSDDIWAENWCKLLKSEKNITLSEAEKQNLLIGISEKDKAQRLENHFCHLKIDNNFKQKLNELHDFGMKNLLVLTDGIEEIFKDNRFSQCIATGGNKYQNDTKNHTVKIDSYFTAENCFTADMVPNGKPAPDLFLLAAQKMRTPVSECIVIEDSLDGIKGARAAGMKVFAFTGAKSNNNHEYEQKCLAAGADKVFNKMRDLHQELLNELRRMP